jgi:ABC-type dipeptide/oligopeptide/nickel transport system permease component
MIRYILRRLVVIPPALLLVHFLGFSYAHLVRPLRAARNPYLAGLGDSEPLIPTYLEYLEGMLRFDFGSMPAPRQMGMGMIPVTKGILLASKYSKTTEKDGY